MMMMQRVLSKNPLFYRWINVNLLESVIMVAENRYNIYSDYLVKKYGCKVYKLPVNIPCTCPNRDGVLGYGGCIFCGDKGAGFENLSNTIPVNQQLEKNKDYIKKKYKAEKFIAYFQNYSNTYIPIDTFKGYVNDACIDDVVELSVSTRPDCINDMYIEYLKDIKESKGVEITVELGLQTVNYHTLKVINRGHTLAEFIEASLKVKKYGLDCCVHIIIDMPWDNYDDAVENAKVLSALGIDQVKLHSLYIVKNTVLADMYDKGKFVPVSVEEYIERVIAFLEHLNPDVVIQRLIGRAPEEDTVMANWNTSWWKIKERIEHELKTRDIWQGKRFDYLGGKALR